MILKGFALGQTWWVPDDACAYVRLLVLKDMLAAIARYMEE